MGNEIQAVWQAIGAARAACQQDPTPMNPPATADEIEQRLARVLGILIPEQLRESLLIHNGISDERGDFFQAMGPGSVDWIIAAWQEDRRCEAEHLAEGDLWRKPPTLIPVFHDATLHREIYINSEDGTMLYFDPAASTEHCFWDYRYPTYADFLNDLLWHIENEQEWEWGSRFRTGETSS